MTFYAFRLETQQASVWAIAPSVGTAHALISAYRDAAGLESGDVMCDLGPLVLMPEEAASAGFALGASSGLYLMSRSAARGC